MILETNPFEIDLIIQGVVGHLRERDLKSCRLVNRKWYLPATRALQRCCKPITFGHLYKVNLIRLRPDLETIKLFTTAMTSSDILPFVKFDLRPSILAPAHLADLENFFEQFGPAIHDLTISLAYESADNYPKRCFPALDLMSLKSLEFNNTLRGEMRPSLRSDLLTTRYNLLENLLAAAPRLETLNLWCDSENLAWPGEAIKVLSEVQLPYLRNLKISFPLTNFQMASLSKIDVQLTSLTFMIREPVFNTEHFFDFLKNQQNTLEALKVVDLQCDQAKFLDLPPMKRLKRLEIEGTFYGDNCTMSLLNFSFKKLPRLEKLILRNCLRRNFDLESLLWSGSCCVALRELHVTLAHDFVNANVIKQLSRTFPNLINLHVMFSPEAKDLLLLVFRHFPMLHYLTINVRRCGENIDSLLTGISNRQILEAGPDFLDKFQHISPNELQLERAKDVPSLLDLKKLKFLELKGEYRNYKSDRSAISDVSAYLAFLQMSCLHNLVFEHTGMNLSQACMRKLMEKMTVVQVLPAEESSVTSVF